MRTLATRGAVWSHGGNYVGIAIMDGKKDVWRLECEHLGAGM